MTPDRLQSVAPFIAVGLLVLALILFALALRYFRKSRTDFYWRRRRSAGQRGWRLFVWSLALTLLSGVICLGTGVAGLLQARALTATAAALRPSPTIRVTIDTNTPTYTFTPSATHPPTLTLTPTITPSPSTTPSLTGTATQTLTPTNTAQTDIWTQAATVTITATRTATVVTVTSSPTTTPTSDSTATPTPSPTITPTVTLGPPSTTILLHTPTRTPTSTASLTPTITLTPSETLVPAIADTQVLDSSVTPSALATLTITALDTQISADFGPVTPGNSFVAGFNRIYYFVKFSAMQRGVLWRRQLVQDGKVLEDSNYLWGLAQEGTTYFFFGQEDGFKAGNYEVRLYLGQSGKPITAAAFVVK